MQPRVEHLSWALASAAGHQRDGEEAIVCVADAVRGWHKARLRIDGAVDVDLQAATRTIDWSAGRQGEKEGEIGFESLQRA